MGKSLVCAYDPGGLYVKDAMLLLPASTKGVSLKYLLGLLNSYLLDHIYREYFVTVDVLKNALLALPIKNLDLNNKDQRIQHDQIVSLVDHMQDARLHLEQAYIERDRQLYARRCVDLDDQINQLVLRIYGLTIAEVERFGIMATP